MTSVGPDAARSLGEAFLVSLVPYPGQQDTCLAESMRYPSEWGPWPLCNLSVTGQVSTDDD